MKKRPDSPPSAARLIDFTRILRRAGRVWTGIDRVELAYIEAALSDQVPAWGLARTPFGYVLLDPTSLAEFFRRSTQEGSFSAPDIISLAQRRLHPIAKRVQTDARNLATARCVPINLARMLRRHLPARTAYLNVGHSNLTDRVLGAVRTLPQASICVFVHDVIPLEYPHFQRAGSVLEFEKKMRRARKAADIFIYNSEDTRRRSHLIMGKWGEMPSDIVAHLGISSLPDRRADAPSKVQTQSPYFVTVGTIEPRKNHKLLLDVWDRMGAAAPMLLICGSRGWNNEATFARLDALGPNARIKELSDLDDAALYGVIKGAHAMLFPSHAEGFGLPALESLSLGTPVLCSNMDTFREILGERAVYLDEMSDDLWEKKIKEWSSQPREALRVHDFVVPTWENHFNLVFSFI